MSWQGSMQCIVTNKTGGPITNVSVSHAWNATQSTSAPELSNGDSILTPFSIETGSGGSDLWTISCVDASGETWGRTDKQCDIEEEDYDSGEAVRITFGPLSEGWSVTLPLSSSCTDNYYDDNGPADLEPSPPYSAMAEIITATALGFVPEVGNLLSGIVYVFWAPSLTGISPWTQIVQQTAQLIDQRIEQEIYQSVEDTLNGLQNDLADYLQAVPTQDYPVIADYWIAADAFFDHDMPSFQQSGYEVNLLPLFAQAANLHLVLLRDGVLFGQTWGWNGAQMQKVQQKLTKQIETYSDYANQYYKQGLQQITLDTLPDDHECEPFASVNRYVRQMTLGVTDLVAVWPYLDPSVYPTPVTPYLDREIYSDPIGTCDDSGPISIDPAQTPTEPITRIAVWGGDRIDAAQVTYPSGGGPGGITQTPRMGDSNGGSDQPPHGGVFDLTNSSQVTVAAGLGSQIPNAFSFTFADGSQTGELGGGYQEGEPFGFSYPGEIMSRLHINGISDFFGSADCAVFGFKFPSFGRLTALTWNGDAWSADSPVGTLTTSAAPALAVFGDALYCFYQGDLDGTLHYCVFDGANWSADQQVPGVQITGSPAAAEFDGRLYVAHQGPGTDTDTDLWCSVFDGQTWQTDTNIPWVGVTAGPALAVYDGSLYCLYKGAGTGSHEGMWCIRHDGSVWQQPNTRVPGVQMTGRPTAVTYGDLLYCFYQGSGSDQLGGDGALWFVRFDGASWSDPQRVSDVGISGSPAAVVFDDALYVLHDGWENIPSAPLWYSVFDGSDWQPDLQVPNAAGATGPAAATFDDTLYCLHQTPAQAPSIEAVRILYIASPTAVELDGFAALPGSRTPLPLLTEFASREDWPEQRNRYWTAMSRRSGAPRPPRR
ncbi:delta endotoxin-like protein [Actinocorallia herbida]|uniref:Delta endotoxin-like protein n=1 Tax=Actinocorallia herbida TaxID=58109 RepID=A0A3N1D1H0_9ACTN|nr:insecticidal delta-endotoxin Cry8Ea1 family protein [Actinocorallia herbida]ROO87362.1 delta endotoxin-like protein [Actinocorallia herbida]